MIPDIGISVVDLLLRSKLCKTRSEAIRALREESVSLSGIRINNSFARLFMFEDRYFLLDEESNGSKIT